MPLQCSAVHASGFAVINAIAIINIVTHCWPYAGRINNDEGTGISGILFRAKPSSQVGVSMSDAFQQIFGRIKISSRALCQLNRQCRRTVDVPENLLLAKRLNELLTPYFLKMSHNFENFSNISRFFTPFKKRMLKTAKTKIKLHW